MKLSYSLLASFALGLAAGLFYHSYAMRGVELELAEERERKQQVIIEYREVEAKANTENTAAYLDEVQREKDRISRDAELAIRVCKADASVRAVEATNSRAAQDRAEADNARLRQDIFSLRDRLVERDAWSRSCWEVVNR